VYGIARLADVIRPELATTIGLLHDLGRIVAPLIVEPDPESAALTELLDPAAPGAALLGSWDLPDRVVRPIAAQREPEIVPPEDIDPEHLAGVAVLYLASPVCAPTSQPAQTGQRLRPCTRKRLWPRSISTRAPTSSCAKRRSCRR
jgi:hypothetical protein